MPVIPKEYINSVSDNIIIIINPLPTVEHQLVTNGVKQKDLKNKAANLNIKYSNNSSKVKRGVSVKKYVKFLIKNSIQ